MNMSQNRQIYCAEDPHSVKEPSHRANKRQAIFQAHGNVQTESYMEQGIRTHEFVKIPQA